MLVLAITIALGVNMPISMERGKGKGRGKKRKATAAVDVNPVEPKNCKTAEQPASPVLTQSQRYVPRFTTKSKRSRVSSSEAVPVAPSQILGTAEDVHEPTQPEKERRTKSSLPEHEAELQAVEQVQQTVTGIHDAALQQLGGVCKGSQVELQTHLDGASCEISDSCGGFEFSACGSGIGLVPGLALSQSNVGISPVLQCHHSNSDVIPSGRDDLKAENETITGLCKKEINQKELGDRNEQLRMSPIGQTMSPPVKIAADRDGKNLELLDLMGSDDDTENEAIGCMERATVEVGEPPCANALDVAEKEAGERAASACLQVEAVAVIDITSRGSLGDDAVLNPEQSDTLQVVSASPDAVLPSSQDHTLAQRVQESFYDGDGCASQEKKNSIISTVDENTSASLTPGELNGSQSPTAERQLSENITFSQQNEVPSIVNSSTIGTLVPESYSMSLLSPAPVPTTDANSALPIETPNFSTPCDTKIGVTMETVKAEWEKSEAGVSVQELMDIAAADLLESQLGCSGDEATVPSCSPASKKQPTSKPPSGQPTPLWLHRPGDVTNTAAGSGTGGGVRSSSETDPGEGTGILRGLIEELSALNRFIMNCKRELDSARKQRSNWLKSQRGRRGR